MSLTAPRRTRLGNVNADITAASVESESYTQVVLWLEMAPPNPPLSGGVRGNIAFSYPRSFKIKG